MKTVPHYFATAFALTALILGAGDVSARQENRIDGSSDAAVEESYSRMAGSLDEDSQLKLQIAVLELNFIGVSSAKESLSDPGLQNPGPVGIKDRIAGLTAKEIIALARKTSTVKVTVNGEEPGVPAHLLSPLMAGKTVNPLASTTWHFVQDLNGFIMKSTLEFGPGGTLETVPPSTNGTSTWEQSADEVRISINDRYAVSRGTFVDANHLRGEGGNKNGSTWTWTAERQ